MLTAIIVDDEENNREMLAEMLDKFFPGRINVLERCDTVSSAAKAIANHHPDVVFLDIEMPNENSFSLIEKTKAENYQVVFVTAYSSYAIEAFKVNAVDYLLKPLNRQELGRALDRLEQYYQRDSTRNQDELLQKMMAYAAHAKTKIGLPSLKGTIFIDVLDILRCEAEGSYTTIHLTDRNVMVSRGLKELEEILKPYNFLRVHKSHLVNLDKVVRYNKADGGMLILSDQVEVPVSRTAKDELEKRLVIL